MTESIIQNLLELNQKNNLEFKIFLDKKSYDFFDVKIAKSQNPVSSPTLRGGVYVSDKFDYKITGTINDLEVVPLLSKTMLGPNTDFTELKLVTNFNDGNGIKQYLIFAYLTNSMQNSSKISLSLSITRIETD